MNDEENVTQATEAVPTETASATPKAPTIADDSYAVAEVIKDMAAQYKFKPELAFKIVELVSNYSLASRQIAGARQPFLTVDQDETDQEAS